MAQFWLAILFLSIITAIYVWDAGMLVQGRPGDTVSGIVSSWSQQQPILPFAVGVLVGHIFW